MISLPVSYRRSGFGLRLPGGGSHKKKPCTEEQSSWQASHERDVPPKKRKALHHRISKRASSPGFADEIDWDQLEGEEEQPLRHDKGLVGRADDQDSPFDEDEVDDNVDEYEEYGVRPISLKGPPRRDYTWANTQKF